MATDQLKKTDVIEYFVVHRVGRNRGIIAAHGRWPFETIRHRGWGAPVAKRKMTPEEATENSKRHRFHCLTYKNLTDLLHDEALVLLPDFPELFQQIKTDLESATAIKRFEQSHPHSPANHSPDYAPRFPAQRRMSQTKNKTK